MSNVIPEIAKNAWGALAGYEPPVVKPKREPAFKQPRKLPDWVWDQYVAALQDDRYAEPGDRNDAYWRNLDVIVKTSKPELWASVEKNRASADKRWQERMKRSKYFREGAAFKRDDDLPELANLATAVVEGFKGHNLHTAKMRKQAGTRINRSARALTEDLLALMEETDRLPYAFGKQFNVAGIKSPDLGVLLVTLEAISLAGKEWAETPPRLGHPNSGNALRLAMLQITREHFEARYGRPLIAAIRGLTSVFHDCDDLSDAAISDLSTSAKRKKSAKLPKSPNR